MTTLQALATYRPRRRYAEVTCHPYGRSQFSGAGNCWCGHARQDRIHSLLAIARSWWRNQ